MCQGKLFHKWSTWYAQKEQDLLKIETRVRIGVIIEQRRTCERCQLTQLRTDRIEYGHIVSEQSYL